MYVEDHPPSWLPHERCYRLEGFGEDPWCKGETEREEGELEDSVEGWKP